MGTSETQTPRHLLPPQDLLFAQHPNTGLGGRLQGICRVGRVAGDEGLELGARGLHLKSTHSHTHTHTHTHTPSPRVFHHPKRPRGGPCSPAPPACKPGRAPAPPLGTKAAGAGSWRSLKKKHAVSFWNENPLDPTSGSGLQGRSPHHPRRCC